MAANPTTIDEYLAAVSDDEKAALERLRRTIRSAAPKAEECISDRLAAFRQDGMLVAFGASPNHCAFYLMSDQTVEAHKEELKAYDTSKGTIRFEASKPLPAALVRKLVKARIAENTRQPTARTVARAKPAAKIAPPTMEFDVDAVVSALKRLATKRTRDGMARYGIPSDKAFGVAVGDIQKLGKRLGRNHELALALWETGWYEARLLTSFVDDPARVTSAQMDRWCRDFDSWAICDTLCFHLFDRTPHAWTKVAKWSGSREEFVKRAGFALLASLAGHDKNAGDDQFAKCLPLIERGAADERNFVKKGVSWALRRIGTRNAALHAAAVKVARRLSESSDAAVRWVGKDALRDLTSATMMRRLAGQRRTSR